MFSWLRFLAVGFLGSAPTDQWAAKNWRLIWPKKLLNPTLKNSLIHKNTWKYLRHKLKWYLNLAANNLQVLKTTIYDKICSSRVITLRCPTLASVPTHVIQQRSSSKILNAHIGKSFIPERFRKNFFEIFYLNVFEPLASKDSHNKINQRSSWNAIWY